MTKLRYVGQRPIGAVSCNKCNENKSSGCIFKVEKDLELDKTILCDSCAKTREEWYKNRENDADLVIIDQ